MLLLIGCSELGANTFNTLAFTYGSPEVALFGFSGIVWAFVAEALIFNNPVSLQ